jgi:ribose/xylose/arabinose/galactoside ABC-type transport system permease subunit
LETARRRISVAGILREWGLIIGIVIIIIVAAIVNPLFLSGDNFLNILRAVSTIGIASVGMAMVVIGGAMDLSIGSTISLVSVVTMLIMNSPAGVDPATTDRTAIIAILVGIGIGALVGVINGAIMALVNGRMGESFIITYAMQIVIGAVAFIVIQGNFQAAKYPAGLFKSLGIGMTPIAIFLVVAIIMQLILAKTSIGRNLYFLGANMNAAKMAGIRTKSVRVVSHILCGACAGLAGVLIVSRVNSASCLQGLGYELEALACVAVGGTSLAGGTGSVAKTVIGVLVIGVLATALNVMGVNSNEQLLVRGGVIIVAVMLDGFNKREKLKEVAQ